MTNRIVQLQPWHDKLLALTEQGEVYDLTIPSPDPLMATLLFSGIPVKPRTRFFLE